MPGLPPTPIRAQFLEGGTGNWHFLEVLQVLPICRLTFTDLDRASQTLMHILSTRGSCENANLGSTGLERVWDLAFLTGFWVMHILLVHGPTLSSKILKNGKFF